MTKTPTDNVARPRRDELDDNIRNIWAEPIDLSGVFCGPPAPLQWLVEHRIQLGRGGLLTGIGGSSKTRMLYQLAVGTAIGRLPWDWRVAKQGRSILVLTEDTREDVHRTLYAVGRGLGLSDTEQATLLERVTVYALAGQDMKLLARDENGTLFKTACFHDLETLTQALGDVVFVGIDPALSVTEGDEASQNDQRTLGKMTDDLAVRTGATVLLAAHGTKGSQQADELASHNSRGGGAVTDAVRMEFSMRTMTAAEARKAGINDLETRKRHVQLVATKGNHLPPSAFVPLWLRRGDHGVLAEADVSFDSNTGPREDDMHALDILRELSTRSTTKLEDWQKACEQKGVLSQPNAESRRKAMSRIKVRLLDAGLITPGFSRGVFLPELEQ